MPFNSKTLPKETIPDLTRPSLRGLSWLLRHREAWPRHHHVWDYSRGRTCATGLARYQWPDAVSATCFNPANDIAAALGLSLTEAWPLFASRAYHPIADDAVTPEMVANRIDAYLQSSSTVR